MLQICVPQLGQNTKVRRLPLAALFSQVRCSPVMSSSERSKRKVARNVLSEVAWQSLQWQMLALFGSASAR